MKATKYRPTNPDDLDWDDNWVSNSLAYFSDTFFPRMCKNPQGLDVYLADKLFTDCPCCLIMRGFVFGACFGVLFALVVYLLFG